MVSDDEHECPVCLEYLHRTVWCNMPCQHRVCFKCLFKMHKFARRSCPLCRHDLDDCLPFPVHDVQGGTLRNSTNTIHAFDNVIRQMHSISVMESALRERNHAPTVMRRLTSMRIGTNGVQSVEMVVPRASLS